MAERGKKKGKNEQKKCINSNNPPGSDNTKNSLVLVVWLRVRKS